MSDHIFIATSYKLNPQQLLGMQIDGKAVVVEIVKQITKEEHREHNPQHTDEDYAQLPEDTSFYEAAEFAGDVVLAMHQEKKPNDIVRNQQLGTWRILRSATPQEYVTSLVQHGETGPGSPVTDSIMTLIQVEQGDLFLYWATPHLAATVPLHLTKEELIFLASLIHEWTHDKTGRGPKGTDTFVIAKIKEALGELVGQDTLKKLQEMPQDQTQGMTQALDHVSVDRVH